MTPKHESDHGIIYNGDCLEVMKEIKSGSVDAIICDPPYGTTQCKWDSIIPLDPMWAELKRIIKPNGAIVMTASQPFTSVLGASNIGSLRYSWVWEKSAATGHLNAKRMPMKNHEDVIVFYSKAPTYNPQGTIDCDKVARRGHNGDNYGKSGTTNRQTKTGYPRTIQAFKSEGKTVHSTQKPVALMEYLIKTYTNPGETVLDFACGSGTTGVACQNTGRKFIMIEKSQEYYDISVSRITDNEKPKVKP